MLARTPERLLSRDHEEIAIKALAFIAYRADELADFRFATGLEPETIRAASRTPQFLAGILDYVVSDEARLERVAYGTRTSPEAIHAARIALLPSVMVGDSQDPHAFGPGPLRLRCEHCGKGRALDRRSWYRVPADVVTISVVRCGDCGGGFAPLETWLDAEGCER